MCSRCVPRGTKEQIKQTLNRAHHMTTTVAVELMSRLRRFIDVASCQLLTEYASRAGDTYFKKPRSLNLNFSYQFTSQLSFTSLLRSVAY